MTRPITPHKGGRTCRAPDARMTPQERGRLDAVLRHYGAKYVNWLIDHVEADYAEIRGNEMKPGKWQVNYKDGEGWQDVDQARAERIIRETYDPADGIINDAKETGQSINTGLALYRYISN